MYENTTSKPASLHVKDKDVKNRLTQAQVLRSTELVADNTLNLHMCVDKGLGHMVAGGVDPVSTPAAYSQCIIKCRFP